MQKLTLTKVFRSTTKKDGTPLIGKNGRPYTKLAIKANEYGDKWLSGFDGKETSSWKEGDVVEAEVSQNGDFLNFSVPKSTSAGNVAVEKLVEKIEAVNINALRAIALIQELARELRDAGVLKNSDGSPMPNFDKPEFSAPEEWNPEDVPF